MRGATLVPYRVCGVWAWYMYTYVGCYNAPLVIYRHTPASNRNFATVVTFDGFINNSIDTSNFCFWLNQTLIVAANKFQSGQLPPTDFSKVDNVPPTPHSPKTPLIVHRFITITYTSLLYCFIIIQCILCYKGYVVDM